MHQVRTIMDPSFSLTSYSQISQPRPQRPGRLKRLRLTITRTPCSAPPLPPAPPTTTPPAATLTTITTRLGNLLSWRPETGLRVLPYWLPTVLPTVQVSKGDFETSVFPDTLTRERLSVQSAVRYGYLCDCHRLRPSAFFQ